jgi:dTDP-4-dehydrorhamnose reductase
MARSRRALDITDANAVEAILADHTVRAVINAAAYTAVDKAETDAAAAQAINAHAPRLLADACAARGLRILHVSTDFVFDGAQGRPYRPDDATNPLGVYGASKLAGEQAVLDSGADAIVVRTGWVYSRHGGNFVKTMLRLMAEREQLGIVDDQIGTPTWAQGLAKTCWALLAIPEAMGIYHWSDAGACSWYDFACAIQAQGLERGLLTRAATLTPIPAADYPTPAQRPPYSVLDKSSTRALLGYSGAHWQDSFAAMLNDWMEHDKELLA